MNAAPEKIYGWQVGHMSIARHYGGINYNGHSYQIDCLDPNQPLVRLDIFKAEAKAKKAAAKAVQPKQEQAVLV